MVFIFSGHFLLTVSVRRRRMSVYNSLFTAVIPLKYTSEFRGLFEATASVFCCCFKHTRTPSFLVRKIENHFIKSEIIL